MTEELDKKLCTDFSELFRNRNKSPRESCLAFGFECGDGWYQLIYALCMVLQYILERNRDIIPDGIIVDQVKEKFGTLHFYISYQFNTNADDSRVDRIVSAINSAIYYAETLSSITCEVCGKLGSVRDTSWVQCLCDEHYINKKDN